MKDKCVFPGSFHPFTLGHRHLVESALKDYRTVIVAVADETYKNDMLPCEIRAKLARKSLADLDGIDVKCFSGMLTDFLRETDCFEVVRGFRNDSDIVYEKQLEQTYLSMDSRVKFRLYPSEFPRISGEEVRRRIGRGESLDGWVSDAVKEDLTEYYGKTDKRG